VSLHRRQQAKSNRRSQKSKTRRRARIAGLGTAAGAALSFAMTPLVSMAPAHADLVDVLVDPVTDWLTSAAAAINPLAGLDIGSLGLGVDAPAWSLPSDLLADLALPANPLHGLEQAFIESPLGQWIDPTANATGPGLPGHSLIDNGIAPTVAASDAGSGGTAVDGGGVAMAAASVAAPAATDPASSAGVGATYAVSSQWNSGFVAGYTITNPGSSTLNNWQLQFNLPADESITNVWNASLSHTGTQYVLTPDSYDTTISPDGSVNVGFQVADTGAYSPPTNVLVDGQSVDSGAGTGGGDTGGTSGGDTGSGSGTAGSGSGGSGSSSGGGGSNTGGSSTGSDTGVGATYAVSSQWNSGFVAGYTITNPGSSTLNNWQLQFNLPADESITNVWNASLSHTGTQYVLTPDSYDTTISPDGSVNVGFQVADTGAYSPPTNVLVDGQSVDSGAGTGGGDTGGTSGGDTGSGSGTAGSGSGGTGGDTASTGDLISAQYGKTTIENAYAVQNNAYNNSAGQSIDVTPTGFSIVNENGSASTDGAPLAYPSIYLGCAYADCSPGSPLPEELSQIQSATSSIDYTFPSNGTYDASYDIWLNPTPITNGVNEQELMIWFDHQGPIQPVGSPIGDATIDGKEFVVWEGNNGSNDVISYVATSPISSWNNFNVLGFIDNMETHEAVDNSWYLTSIQAGFEPWSGSTGAAVNSFSASVNGVS
jgi:hypothetical protein